MQGDIVCADTREAYDERNQYLEEAGEHEALLGFVDALRGKTLLDDVLVEAPVAQICQPYAADNRSDTRHVSKCALAVALLNYQVQVAVIEMLP